MPAPAGSWPPTSIRTTTLTMRGCVVYATKAEREPPGG
jgi:hypothetical protein